MVLALCVCCKRLSTQPFQTISAPTFVPYRLVSEQTLPRNADASFFTSARLGPGEVHEVHGPLASVLDLQLRVPRRPNAGGGVFQRVGSSDSDRRGTEKDRAGRRCRSWRGRGTVLEGWDATRSVWGDDTVSESKRRNNGRVLKD